MHLLLTNLWFHATQKTKTQRKKILSPKLTKSFCVLFFVDPLPRSAKGAPGFGACVAPKVFWFFFDSKKEHQLRFEAVFEGNCVIKNISPLIFVCIFVKAIITLSHKLEFVTNFGRFQKVFCISHTFSH